MGEYRLVKLNDVNQLRQAAAQWDELWQRSLVQLPTLRAEPLAQWIEKFASDQELCVMILADDDRFVAALPLIERRIKGVVRAGEFASAFDPRCGLLLDPGANASKVARGIATAMNEQAWRLLWLEEVEIESPTWRALWPAFDDVGMSYQISDGHQVGRTVVDGTWQEYQNTWSKSHRKSLRKSSRQLDALGAVELKLIRGRCDDLHEHLRRGFEVEDRCWKGSVGDSVVKVDGMFDFYCQQAEDLTEHDQLQLAFLELDGKAIAFEYGYIGKETYYSVKVGYDQAFAKYAPGKLLTMKILESFFANRACRYVDYLGKVTNDTRRWMTEAYTVSRVVIGANRLTSRVLVQAYRHLRPIWQRSPLRKVYREGKARALEKHAEAALDELIV